MFLDDYAGIDSDARLHALCELIGAAARGEDVQLRASALIADLAQRHAAYQLADALCFDEEDDA